MKPTHNLNYVIDVVLQKIQYCYKNSLAHKQTLRLERKRHLKVHGWVKIRHSLPPALPRMEVL